MKCGICGLESRPIFRGRVLGTHDIQYFLCPSCLFLQTEDPYWLDQAHQDVINIQDTGLLTRNIALSRRVAVLLYFLFDRRSLFVDYAGGYGVFARLMRDIGFDFYWHDPKCQNIFSRGFEWNLSTYPHVEAVTCFEAFEHFSHPQEEIQKILEFSRTIIFTTVLLPAQIPSPGQWWYYGFFHGQHVSFYSLETLRHIAAQHRLRLFTNRRDFHLLPDKPINSSVFSFLSRFTNYCLFQFVWRRMKSRTFEDMNRPGPTL